MIAIPIFNNQGKAAQDLELNVALDRKEESPQTFARAIRALLQNWRLS